MNGHANRQRGVVLILSLIMLMVLTLIAVSAIRLSTVNLRTVANAQSRIEAMSTAQRTIDLVLSSNFTDNIAGTASTVTVAEGGKNYTVVIARPCLVRSAPILNIALPEPEAAPPGKPCGPYPECTCRKGVDIDAYSQCSDTIWQIQASSSSGWFGANVSITQGTGIRMDNGKVTAYSNEASYRCTGT
ncbi:MAG: pilus assembly PilX N-terminal domain-containing protein [Sulfuritalea sp.]|nr:pilus assembly PilX N-terminal domain-containing protein [Sulfuritalea sp.]